ncbi:MAG TPA: hypothetical protein DCZ93_08930 [Elusimicrobia bacterium]|nr:hypothetical protein [Elusimicrobiota bacterium]
MGTLFSDALCKARKDAGFVTAYRFFHDNGGAKALGFSYRQYLLMEQGKSLPACSKLYKLFLSLRVYPLSAETFELADAWLRTMVGEEAYKYIFEQFLPVRTGKEKLSPLHTALKSALIGRTYYLTFDQSRAILSSADTYLCFNAMQNDTDRWSVAQIAKALCLKETSADKAMKILAGAKILKRMGKNVYKCPLASMLVEFPNLEVIDQELKEKVKKYDKDLVDSGVNKWRRAGIIRADAPVLYNSYPPLMSLNVSAAYTYNTTRKTDNSALFFVESRLVKLRDF